MTRNPDGYAYRYHAGPEDTVLRFNGGQEVNGARPIEAVPYWLGEPSQPEQQGQAVAYLDIGAGGYTDVGSDLTDEQLAALPKGRHMLGIIGMYGIDGYRPQPAGGDAVRALDEAEAARITSEICALLAERGQPDPDGGGAILISMFTASEGVRLAVERGHAAALSAAPALLQRAVPFLHDEGSKYEDDGSNEPLELAREIETFLAASPSDESALSSASLAFDGGEVAPCPHGDGACDCSKPPDRLEAALSAAPIMTFSLGEAVALLQSFGGSNCSMSVQEWDATPGTGDEDPARAGKYAWCTEYPEEGATWLGQHDPDTEGFDGRDAAQPEAAPAVPAVPEGWLAVPYTPTTEQLDAARDWSYRAYGKPVGNEGARGCYTAMLDAAPKPAAGEDR